MVQADIVGAAAACPGIVEFEPAVAYPDIAEESLDTAAAAFAEDKAAEQAEVVLEDMPSTAVEQAEGNHLLAEDNN